MPCLQVLSGGEFVLGVHVQPRASKNELAGLHGESLKVRLASPPVDGKANKGLLAFLAGELQVPKSALAIRSGHKSREKKVLVTGIAEDMIRQRLGLDG